MSLWLSVSITLPNTVTLFLTCWFKGIISLKYPGGSLRFQFNGILVEALSKTASTLELRILGQQN